MTASSSILIVIDGPVASGKSTVAKAVSQRLDLFHLSVGGLHRSNAWALRDTRIDLGDEISVVQRMTEFNIQVDCICGDYCYLVNGTDITSEIFTPDIGELASRLALFDGVEARIHNLAREIAQEKGRVIADGRGLCSILPNADIKVFLNASIEARTYRCQMFMQRQGRSGDIESLAEQIRVRDHRDQTRPKHPLKMADDAVVIDSTDLTVSAVIDQVVDLIKDYQSCN